MHTEKLVTAIRVNGPVIKGMTMRGKGFIQPVILTLEDGREVESSIDNERKKNLAVTFARKEAAIARKAYKADFDDQGEFCATIETGGFGFTGGGDQ